MPTNCQRVTPKTFFPAGSNPRSRATTAILDSQSVKSDGHGGFVGSDAGKQIKGRKRHLLVDTLGLVLGVIVTAANWAEREGAKALLRRVLPWFTWLRLLWVDGGWSGPEFAHWVGGMRPKLKVEVVKRSEKVTGFQVLPRRGVVERTFGWLMRHRLEAGAIGPHGHRLANALESLQGQAEAGLTASAGVVIHGPAVLETEQGLDLADDLAAGTSGIED